MVVAVVTVAVPGHLIDQAAATGALLNGTTEAGRTGLRSRCNEADRKGSQPCRKKRLSLHQASPLVLGLFPGTPLPYGATGLTGDDSRWFPHIRSQRTHEVATVMSCAPAPPLGL